MRRYTSVQRDIADAEAKRDEVKQELDGIFGQEEELRKRGEALRGEAGSLRNAAQAAKRAADEVIHPPT